MNRTKSYIALAVLLVTPSLFAQITPIPPSQFATAQTAFLGAGGAPALGNKAKLVTSMTYDSMYRALSSMNKYRLVPAPSDSNILMAVSIFIAVGTAPNQFNSASLRLTVHDTKTNALLWIIDEPVDGAFRAKTFQKNVADAAARIIADLKALAAGSIPGDTSSPAPVASASPAPINPCVTPKQPKTRISQQPQEKQ